MLPKNWNHAGARTIILYSPSTMEARLVRRPIIDLLSGKRQCLLSLNTTARRHQSSTRRTKHYLNVKPHDSFLPNPSIQHDHIIFNPPSSAPSVIHTPIKFLPKEDKRRPLFATIASRQANTAAKLPPIIERFKPWDVPKHHLKDSDILEIQRLRASDPEKWTVLRLSKKFNCARAFIMMCSSEECPEEKKDMDRQRLEATKARWGPRKTRGKEDRMKRIELALKDA